MPKASSESTKLIRLQKFIADCGVTSRRKAETLIEEGRVKVNGFEECVLGTKVNPESDVVAVDDIVIDLAPTDKVYIVLNKPRGVMTTVNDPEGRTTVMDLIGKNIKDRFYPVGRLDYLSEGLLIMTNDGELAHKVLHPSFEVMKIYEVKVFGIVTQKLLNQLRNGAVVDGVKLKPQSVRVIKQLQKKTWLEFRLTEGKNREIRKLCESHGLTVDKLKRVAIEGLTINGIKPGGYRLLDKNEILKALNFNKDWTRIKSTKPTGYVSPKRTVHLKKNSKHQKGALADDEIFKMYRRENYFDTLQIKKDKALELAAKEAQEEQELSDINYRK